MPAVLEPARTAGRRLHRPLLMMVASMALLLVVSAVGMVADDRVLLGAPVWGKPLKFAVSFIVYGLTLAWLLTLPHRASRWTWWMATLLAVTGILDVGVVVVQAARGTFSHFNQADDPFNNVIQVIFGVGVQLLMLANFVLAGLLIFQRVGDRVLTWAIRAGLTFVIAGIGLGLLIPMRSSEVWTAKDAAGHAIPLAAQHNVGVPDGGPGLPLTGWSTVGGDLRIPHFVGLHGLQVMLVVALVLGFLASRVTLLRDERTRAGLMIVAAAAYAGLIVLVTWQALRGQALIHPDGQTLGALALLMAATTAASWAVLAAGGSPGPRRVVRSVT
ncbi:hypothetical protein OHA25_48365 [Nonomuraea sp. NBC_00507]|uniref:hypothetical protein n=1 Tax=Nonomuraea sp. NBC_00507 TaxID=2976002 RepID=UPI002E18150E